MTTSPSDLPVNDIGTERIHKKHTVVLEESDTKFARARVKDQLFVDWLLMQDFLSVQQHQQAEHYLEAAMNAGIYIKSPRMTDIIISLEAKPQGVYSSGLMRWANIERSIKKRWGGVGVEIIHDHVVLDVWTSQQQKINLLAKILDH